MKQVNLAQAMPGSLRAYTKARTRFGDESLLEIHSIAGPTTQAQ